MPNDPVPYVDVKPGDLITADLFNAVQVDVQKDMAQQIKTSIDGITNVKHSDDAGTLGGLTTDQLTSQILDKVKAMIPSRTGYKRVFRRLQVAQPNIIEHGLGAEPVVQVWQLGYFQVVCAQGENAADAIVEYVNFYLYHTSEMHVRGTVTVQPAGQPPPPPTTTTTTVTIEDPRRPGFRISFKDMLAEFGVDTTNDGRTLDELVTGFWAAMFSKAAQNDGFDPDQYCHSPWMEKCCGELRTIKELRDRGDWDNIWFKMLPFKTVNYPAVNVIGFGGVTLNSEPFPLRINNANINATQPQPPGASLIPPSPGPTQIEVAHLDLNTAGIMLVADPVPPQNAPDALKNELPVMVLLKA
jgi:hypothetical protein